MKSISSTAVTHQSAKAAAVGFFEFLQSLWPAPRKPRYVAFIPNEAVAAMARKWEARDEEKALREIDARLTALERQSA